MNNTNDLNLSMARHPAGKKARRPGVRRIELAPQFTIVAHVNTIVPAVYTLECLVCGALLALNSPLAEAHTERHRGPRWRRAIRDARTRLRLWLQRNPAAHHGRHLKTTTPPTETSQP